MFTGVFLRFLYMNLLAGIFKTVPCDAEPHELRRLYRYHRNAGYYGQSALPLPPETLYYLSNDVLDSCVVTNHEDQTVGSIYNMEKKSPWWISDI